MRCDLLTIAAHDRGVDAVAGDRRVLREEALRRAVVHPVVALAVHVVIPARELQERRDALVVGPPTRLAFERGRLRACRRSVRQRRPALVAVLARERVLDVAQHGIGGRAADTPARAARARRDRRRAAPSASAWLLAADCRGCSRDTFLPLCLASAYSGRKKVRGCGRTDGWEATPLPRTGGAPARTGVSVRRLDRTCQPSGVKPNAIVPEGSRRSVSYNCRNAPVAQVDRASAF